MVSLAEDWAYLVIALSKSASGLLAAITDPQKADMAKDINNFLINELFLLTICPLFPLIGN